MDMQQIRAKIDALDDTIQKAFAERMALAGEMAAYKKANGLPVFHPAREAEIIERLTAADADMAEYTAALYQTVFALSRAYQEKKIADAE